MDHVDFDAQKFFTKVDNLKDILTSNQLPQKKILDDDIYKSDLIIKIKVPNTMYKKRSLALNKIGEIILHPK